MILETEEDINKVDWFISGQDNCLYGFYEGFILYSFDIFEYNYSINYTDRGYVSHYTISDSLIKKINKKNLIIYQSVDFFIKMKKREEKLNNLLESI